MLVMPAYDVMVSYLDPDNLANDIWRERGCLVEVLINAGILFNDRLQLRVGRLLQLR
jgi:hypothetical protein